MSGLAMKTRCERCEVSLGFASEAYVCSYECTFCAVCASAFAFVCPNCKGELVRRPRRSPVEAEACPVAGPLTAPPGRN